MKLTHTVNLKGGESFEVETSCVGLSMIFFNMIMNMDAFRWGDRVIVPRRILSVSPGPYTGLPEDDPTGFWLTLEVRKSAKVFSLN